MQHGYVFEDFTSTAPHGSATWAASDRGWLYDPTQGCYDGSGWCVGFYLSYAAVPGYRGAFVLAQVYDRYENHLTGTCGTTRTRSRDCATVAEARAWMLAEVSGQLSLL